jgi:hypothetical protein
MGFTYPVSSGKQFHAEGCAKAECNFPGDKVLAGKRTLVQSGLNIKITSTL